MSKEASPSEYECMSMSKGGYACVCASHVSVAPGEVVFPDKFSVTHLVQILSPFISASRQSLGRSTFTNYGLQHEASSLHESDHTAWRSRSSSVSKRMRELILLTTHTQFLIRVLELKNY